MHAHIVFFIRAVRLMGSGRWSFFRGNRRNVYWRLSPAETIPPAFLIAQVGNKALRPQHQHEGIVNVFHK